MQNQPNSEQKPKMGCRFIFDSIHIGAVIAQERHKRGMTQGEVADFVGVSKAAVSKWELGVSLPDITVLPKLSGLFSISIEELLDYEATLPEEAVREVFETILEEFKSDATAAFEHLDTIVRLHFSSWSLLFTAATLLLEVGNGGIEAAEGVNSERIIQRGVEYCERIECDCPNETLVQRAKKLHAIFLLLLNKDAKDDLDGIIALLGPNAETDVFAASLLAEAYFISGDIGAAKELFQRMLTNGVDLILASLPFIMQLMPDGNEAPNENEAAIADCSTLALQLYFHFGAEGIDPLVVLGILFSGALISLSRGDKDGAQAALSSYALVVGDMDGRGSSQGKNAPLRMLARAKAKESLGELTEERDALQYSEGAFRILRSHVDALSSKAWDCLVGTEGFESALDGARRAISRLENYEKCAT